MLTNIKYSFEYCTLDCDVDSEFYIPSYKESVKLDRGVGYFSLRSLILDIEGIIPFIENGGRIRLICNPELQPSDVAVIDIGTSLSPDDINKILIREVTKEYNFSDSDLDALDIICNMIAEKRLVIRIAYMPIGIYHEKNGIFEDAEGNKVYFTGSQNETQSAKRHNYEQIEVHTSWEGGSKRIQAREEKFEALWNNDRGERINVIDFPEAVEAKLFTSYRKSEKLDIAVKKYKHKKNNPAPKGKQLYKYQEDAINEFVNNGYRHFYEMATGTGKTFTSIRTITRVLQDKGKVFVAICVPQVDLQEQWEEALIEEGYTNLYFAGGVASKRSSQSFNEGIISYMIDDDSVICIAVYDTFFDKVYDKLSNIDQLFIIVDEAHNLNPAQVKKLPKNATYRLGLSATAERYVQHETKLFLNYFTNDEIQPFYYGIESAIEKGFLSHYIYEPIFVHFTDERFDVYKKKSQLIASLQNQPVRDEEAISRHCRERGLLIKQEPNKLDKLQELTRHYNFKNSVVYCGQGKDGEDNLIDRASRILYEAGYRTHHYTSKTEDRTAVKKLFTENYFDTLVAIRCLDEGVDIPKLDKIYIMSSETSMRQTVQRRGRVLRICKNTGKDIAYIYDMVLLPPKGVFDGGGIKSLIVSEFTRVHEYNRLADNKLDNETIINDIFELYNITPDDFNNEPESI